MKFRVWALLLGVICLLQHPVSAEPRPDFALDATLYGATKVSGAIEDASVELGTINTQLTLTLETDYPGLTEMLYAMQEIGGTLSGIFDSLLGPLAYLTTSDSNSDFGAFYSVLGGVSSIQGFLTGRVSQLISNMQEIVGYHLPAQMEDTFERIYYGLDELGDAVSELQNAVGYVLSMESSEEYSHVECVQLYVRPKLVYRVVYAMRTLRAYIPLVTYVLTTTVENLAIADQFLVRLAEEVEEVQEVSQYIDRLDSGALPIAVDLSNAFSSLQSELSSVEEEISDLSNIQGLSSFGELQSALGSFDMTLGLASGLSEGFYFALDEIGNELESFLVPDSDIPTVDNARVVQTLVLTLVANGPFARYCFYKYSELLFGYADVGLNAVEQCIDREIVRLQYLRETLLRMVDMLVYDLEDLADELAVCDSLRRANRRRACVESLAEYYSDLAANFQTKVSLIFDVGVTEATASKFRLLTCVNTLQIRLINESNYVLRRQIRKCAKHGPYHESSSEEGGEGDPTLRGGDDDEEEEDMEELGLA